MENKELNHRLIRVIALTITLIDELDELEKFNLYKHSIKRKGNVFKKELEKQVTDVWNSGNKNNKSAMSKNTDRIAMVIDTFNESLKQIL